MTSKPVLLVPATFSDQARKERRNVLAASVIGILIGATNLVPTKLATLGLTFEVAEQRIFLFVVAGVQLYFLLSFLIYARSDWLVMKRNAFDEFVENEVADYKTDILEGSVELANPRGVVDEAVAKFRAEFAKDQGKLRSKTQRATQIRTLWDYPLPIALGLVSLALLLWQARTWAPLQRRANHSLQLPGRPSRG